MKKYILLSLFSIVLFLSTKAGFEENLSGTTTITLDIVPVRIQYPDGRILQVLTKNSNVSVIDGAGDGTGMWLQILFTKNGKKITGFVDSRFTSYEKDFKSGRVFQP
jgi:hypothetical protein